MSELPVTVGFPFRREFVPRRCRTTRTEWFRGECGSIIKVIEPREAPPAFRVTFPERESPFPSSTRRVPEIGLVLLRHDATY